MRRKLPDNEPTRPLPLAVNKQEAAKLLGIGRTTMWRLIDTGEIPVISHGLVPVQALRDWLEKETVLARKAFAESHDNRNIRDHQDSPEV